MVDNTDLSLNIRLNDDLETVHVFDEYTEYTKLEHHIALSKAMFDIDIKGRHIVKELQKKKSTGVRKRTGTHIFSDDISIVYNNIVNCLSLKRLRLYFCLQYFLDELMYYEIKNTNNFYIEDNIYPISKMYFAQQEWISDQCHQEFQFYEDAQSININEAMYLVCYLKEYDSLLLDVEEYTNPFKRNKNVSRVRSKLRETIHRVRCRHKNVWTVLLDIINKNIDTGEPTVV
jgi:hypothetical protein